MDANPLYATTGAAGGLSFAALLEWAKNPSTISAAAFVGSVASTLLGWFLARRREIARANLEIERDRRAMERQELYLDKIAARAVEAHQAAAAQAAEPAA